MLLAGKLVCFARVSMGELALLHRRRCVLLGCLMVALVVVMGRFTVMMGCRRMMSCCRHMVL